MSRARVGGGKGHAAEVPESSHDDAALVETSAVPLDPNDFSDTEPPPDFPEEPVEEDVPVRVDTKRKPPKVKKAKPGHRWAKAQCVLRRADGDVAPSTVLELAESAFRHFLSTGAVIEQLE